MLNLSKGQERAGAGAVTHVRCSRPFVVGEELILLKRLRRLASEAMRFGAVGAAGFIVDVSLFNALRYAGDPGLLQHKPLTAKAISVAAATVVTYLGNRHWTWSHRARSGARREVTLFLLVNGVGMAIALVCLAISHYALDLRSPLADNISANGFGLVLGMMFRFWGYRTYVFRRLPPSDQGSESRVAVTTPRSDS